MRPDSETLEQRVARLEQSLAEISARLDSAPRAESPPPPRQAHAASGVASAAPAAKRQAPPRRPLPSRTAEWWLARGGAVLTSVALILLYQYAVERSWITPLVRVLMGTAVGAALMISASKVAKRNASATEDVIGFREVLLGAALSAWYITSYAAAVFYQLIPFSTARLLFVALTILGAWLALKERRAILALLALGAGFSTPQLLPSPTPSIPAFALFLATLSAVGLILYLMRGWQSVLWLTFIAFWGSAFSAAELLCCGTTPGILRLSGSVEVARISMTLLVLVTGAAMARVPILRRKLIGVGSHLYTEPNRSTSTERIQKTLGALLQVLTGYTRVAAFDSPALWLISLSSPLLVLAYMQMMWSIPSAAWGIASLLLAFVAYRLAFVPQSTDDELTHVEVAATVVYSLAGVLWIADSLGKTFQLSPAAMIIALSLHAFVTLYYLRASQFVTARRIGLWAAGVNLIGTVLTEIMLQGPGPDRVGIAGTIAELTTISLAIWIFLTFRRQRATAAFPGIFGVVAYVALMLVDARVLGDIWAPLVTASYAIAGTALLVISRGRAAADARALRRLGGFTLVVVVARLLMVDLAGVATIWKVLLFLGCGALFLFTSHLLQTPRESPEPAA